MIVYSDKLRGFDLGRAQGLNGAKLTDCAKTRPADLQEV